MKPVLSLALAAVTPLVMAAAGPACQVAVHVADAGNGKLDVTGTFAVPVPQAVAWRVLTDYDALGTFVPAMRSHLVSRSGPNSGIVDQDTVTGVLGVGHHTHVVLGVHETPPGRIDFVDLAHRDFERFEGSWRLETEGSGTRVRYAATVRPRYLPPVLGRAVLEATLDRTLLELCHEILRRSRQAGR